MCWLTLGVLCLDLEIMNVIVCVCVCVCVCVHGYTPTYLCVNKVVPINNCREIVDLQTGLIQKSEQRDGTEFDRISSHSKKERNVTSFISLCMYQLHIKEQYNNSYGTDNESVSMATTSF